MSTASAQTCKMTIAGEAIVGSEQFGVINPATGQGFDYAPECSPAQLDVAMAAAEGAFESWRLDESVRRTALLSCSTVIKNAVDQLAPILTREQGKPLSRAVVELKGAAKWFDYTARLEIPREVALDNDHVHVEVRRRPYGVVAAITPWN